MRGLITCLLILTVFIPPSIGNAQEGPLLAVFDIEDQGSTLESQALANLTSYLSARLAECGYRVIPQDQIRDRLKTQKKGSYKACYDQSCQIDLGRELAAQKVLASRILKIAGECKLTSSLYDLEKAATDVAATESGDCGEASLSKATDQVAIKLCRPVEKMRAQGKKAISDFAAVLKNAQNIKEHKARIENAWAAVNKMAQDSELPRTTRVELLQKFLEDFSKDNPYRPQAQKLIASILPGSLLVRTRPPKAWVSIDGNTQGRSPVTVQLAPGEYQVRMSLEGHLDRNTQVVVNPGKQTELSLELQRFYPMDPVTKWGHVSFWSGLGVAVLGGLAAWQMSGKRDEYYDGSWGAKEDIELWTGMMFTGLGTGVVLMGVGAIMWLMAPTEEEWQREWDRQKGVGLVPAGQGGLVLTFGGEW